MEVVEDEGEEEREFDCVVQELGVDVEGLVVSWLWIESVSVVPLLSRS